LIAKNIKTVLIPKETNLFFGNSLLIFLFDVTVFDESRWLNAQKDTMNNHPLHGVILFSVFNNGLKSALHRLFSAFARIASVIEFEEI